MITKTAFETETGSLEDRFFSLLSHKTEQDLSRYRYDNQIPHGSDANNERIAFICKHHFQLLADEPQEKKEIRDVELLTSRLADREIQKDELIRLSDGYFYVAETFIGGGAYTAILHDIKGKSSPKLVCRGTGQRGTKEYLNSHLSDIEWEMGTMGVEAIWSKLSSYLTDKDIRTLKVYGKSLGGAHAQRLAVKIEGELKIDVQKLTTLGSVGVGEKTNQFFIDTILPNRKTPFHIHVIRNSGSREQDVDLIPTVGGVHLGAYAPCKRTVTYLTDPGERWVAPLNPTHCRLISSLDLGHCRQMTLEDFSFHNLEEELIDRHLEAGTLMETSRKVIAYVSTPILFLKRTFLL